jgi:hypothetical protein
MDEIAQVGQIVDRKLVAICAAAAFVANVDLAVPVNEGAVQILNYPISIWLGNKLRCTF